MKSFHQYVILWFVSLFFTFSLFAQTPEELKSYLPAISGWSLSGELEVFNPDNLFDRINGAAPLFIENNFREMTSLEYKKGDDYITIQAYRHATPEDAFGMYAAERSGEQTIYPIGGEAQGDGQNLSFFVGAMYIKIRSNSADDLSQTFQTIGKALAGKIAPDATYPPLVKCFPAEGKIPYSEAYITSGYIGHEFLKAVYFARYEKGGQPLQYFIVDAKSAEGAKEVITKYLRFSDQSLEVSEGDFLIKDKYNGDIPLVWKGRYIVGLWNEDGAATPDVGALLQTLVENLPKEQ